MERYTLSRSYSPQPNTKNRHDRTWLRLQKLIEREGATGATEADIRNVCVADGNAAYFAYCVRNGWLRRVSAPSRIQQTPHSLPAANARPAAPTAPRDDGIPGKSVPVSQTEDLFAACVREIEAAYQQLGHRLGWRFLMTPRRTFAASARTALITLNPGGDHEPPDHPKASSEIGSAYVHETWPRFGQGMAPLQQQVQWLFKRLGEDPHETLSAYFVPFRSPDLKSLVNPARSIQFARSLWRRILLTLHPTLIVCLGRDVHANLRVVLGSPMASEDRQVSWGTQTATIDQYPERVLLRLPHLSRYGLFNRSAAADGILAELLKRVDDVRAAL